MEGKKHPLLGGDTSQAEVSEASILMVYITSFIDSLAGSISSPVLPYYAKSFGVPIRQIGWLYGAWSFSSTVFAPWLSRAGDKWGRRPILILSLLGAGTANIIQGTAGNFYVFLFGRFFSGAWAAVGATCNVYISDVIPEAARPAFLSRLATVPFLAVLFGPGLGGGLAKFGLNVPVLVDGTLTLFSACVVSYYLQETPSFLRLKLQQQQADLTGEADAQKSTSGQVSWKVHTLGVASFLGGISFSTLSAMFAIFMTEKFAWDVLDVGFSWIACSILILLTNIWALPCLRKRINDLQVSVLGCALVGVAMVAFGLADSWISTMIWFGALSVGHGLRMASSAAVIASFTDNSNRGKIFAYIQVYTNCGRMLGPVLATHLAEFGVGVPFIWTGGLAVIAALINLLAGRKCKKEDEAGGRTMKRKPTHYGQDWQNEEGSSKDIEEIGNFVADLLTRRHYKWVSKRADIEQLLDKLLPELETWDKDSYEASVEALMGRLQQ